METIYPVDPNVRKVDIPRLVGQNALLYEMLQRGPVTPGMAWAAGIRRAAARIHDLREAGIRINTAMVGNEACYSLT